MTSEQPSWASSEDWDDDEPTTSLPPKKNRSKTQLKKPETKNSPSLILWIGVTAVGGIITVCCIGFGTRHFYLQAQEKSRVANAAVREAENLELVRVEAHRKAEEEADRVVLENARIAKENARIAEEDSLRIAALKHEQEMQAEVDAEAFRVEAERVRAAAAEAWRISQLPTEPQLKQSLEMHSKAFFNSFMRYLDNVPGRNIKYSVSMQSRKGFPGSFEGTLVVDCLIWQARTDGSGYLGPIDTRSAFSFVWIDGKWIAAGGNYYLYSPKNNEWIPQLIEASVMVDISKKYSGAPIPNGLVPR